MCFKLPWSRQLMLRVMLGLSLLWLWWDVCALRQIASAFCHSNYLRECEFTFAEADNKPAHQPEKCWEIGCLCGAVCLFKSAISFPMCPSAHGLLGSIQSVSFSRNVQYNWIFIAGLLIIINLLKYLCKSNSKWLIYYPVLIFLVLF